MTTHTEKARELADLVGGVVTAWDSKGTLLCKQFVPKPVYDEFSHAAFIDAITTALQEAKNEGLEAAAALFDAKERLVVPGSPREKTAKAIQRHHAQEIRNLKDTGE